MPTRTTVHRRACCMGIATCGPSKYAGRVIGISDALMDVDIGYLGVREEEINEEETPSTRRFDWKLSTVKDQDDGNDRRAEYLVKRWGMLPAH